MRAQCYDGAANIKGRYKGVSTRFQQEKERAVTSMKCHAHVLDLTLAKACTSVQDICNVVAVVDTLYKLMEGSAKRHCRFKGIQEFVDSARPTTVLKRICETRWSSRYEAVRAIKVTFRAIVQTLQSIANDDAELGSDAVCLQQSVEMFYCYFYISVLKTIWGKQLFCQIFFRQSR